MEEDKFYHFMHFYSYTNFIPESVWNHKKSNNEFIYLTVNVIDILQDTFHLWILSLRDTCLFKNSVISIWQSITLEFDHETKPHKIILRKKYEKLR